VSGCGCGCGCGCGGGRRSDTVAVLEVIGIRVVVVPNLGKDALLLIKDGILLVDASLKGERLDYVADKAVAAVVAALN
jgi:hypothetical protein